jgi:sRNA-binding protein
LQKTDVVNGQNEHAQTKAKVAQEQTDEVKATVEKAQAPTEEPQASTEEDTKLTSVPGGKALGMSILGNQDAPKSLVIVPWKSSELGDSQGTSPMLDDSRQPVDKEVFMRALRYYEIRSGTKP